MRITATPFYLRLPRESEIGLTASRSRDHDVSGIARFDGRQLVLEWSDRARVSEISLTTSRQFDEVLGTGSCVLSLTELASAELRGGWWRPRLEITTTNLASVAEVPGVRAGRLVLWLFRQDRSLAQELRSELRMAIAEAALQAAERPPELPTSQMAERPSTLLPGDGGWSRSSHPEPGAMVPPGTTS